MPIGGQSRRSQSLGAGDPRNRRAGAAWTIDSTWIGEGLTLDGQGRLTVDPIPAIGSLSDVDHSTNPAQGQTLKYNATTREWTPGLFGLKRTATAASYTALASDELIGVTSTAAARTITLPTAASMSGRTLVVKDESGGAAVNNITVDGNGAETIDGAANIVIATNYGAVTIYSTGSAWFSV